MRELVVGTKGWRALALAGISGVIAGLLVAPSPAFAATIPPPTPSCPSSATPVLTSFAASASTINAKASNGHITFTATATDTKPITRINVGLVSRYVYKVHKATRRTISVDLTLTQGTATNGTWKGTATIPKDTIDGTWKISEVYLVDFPRNADRGPNLGYAYYTPDEDGGTLGFQPGWPVSFQVTSTDDVKAPLVSSLKLSHPSANTTKQTQTLVATIVAQDTLSGVKSITVGGQVSIGGHMFATRGGILAVKTPIVAKHTYRVSMLIPKGVGNGTHTWSLYVAATDAVGNTAYVDRAHLLSRHATSTFKVVSKADVTPPKLTSLTFSASSVNALTSDQKVTVTAKATDAVSGVGQISVNFRSPSGNYSYILNSYYASAALTGKAGNSVTWKGTVTIPRCGEPGTWTINDVRLVDGTYVPGGGIGNGVDLTPAQLMAKGFPTTLAVQDIDIQPPTFTVPATVAHAGPVGVTFDKPVLMQGSENALLVYDISAGLAAVSGTWTCKNASDTTVGCNDTDADVTTASFQPSSDLTAGHRYGVIAQTPYNVGLGHSDDTVGLFDTLGNGPAQFSVSFQAS